MLLVTYFKEMLQIIIFVAFGIFLKFFLKKCFALKLVLPWYLNSKTQTHMKQKNIISKRRYIYRFCMFWVLSFSCFSYSQTVTLNQIPQFSCPAGNMNICGTFAAPPVGGPFQPPTFNVSIVGVNVPIPVLVNGGTNITATIIGNTYCINVPVTVFGINPQQGTYEIEITANFTQANSPFAVTSVDATGTNPNSSDDIFLGNCPIVANNDAVTFNQCANQTINVLANDTFLGVAAALNTVIITPIGATAPIILNTATGIASIPVGTVAGTYTANYQICNSNNATQCDLATITFTITAPPIVANNDTFSLNTCTGGSTTSILNNDTTCGTPIATPVFVSFVGVSPIAGATISNLGVITIPAGTPQGSYTFSYNVCPTAFPIGCSNTATATINVVSTISAVNDNFSSIPINTLYGGLTTSILTNDILNGSTPTSANVAITLLSSSPTIVGLQNNSVGQIVVPVGVTVGTYTITYCITQIGCATNVSCGSATIVVSDFILTPDALPGIRANNIVRTVDTQSDNKIIISGYFTEFNGNSVFGIARLNTNLTLDTTSGFNVSGGLPTAPISTISPVPQDINVIKNAGANLDKILLVGSFVGYSGSTSQGKGIARLLPDGNIDPTFNSGPIVGTVRGISGSNQQIRTLYVYPDNAQFFNAGKILIGGMFSRYNGVDREKMARLNADGSIDETFNPNGVVIGNNVPGFNSAPQAIEVDNNGKIIVGGFFTKFNGSPKENILRLNNDGSIDDTFNQAYINSGAANPNLLFGGFIQKIVIQPDNNIIIGGFFSKYNNVSRNSIARILPTGVLDINFNPGVGFFPVFNPVSSYGTEPLGMIRSMVFEPAVGAAPLKLYVSGNFTKYNNLTVPKVILINCATTGAGGRDNTFRVGPNLTSGGPNNYVWSMKKQGAKLILGGEFTDYNGLSALRVTRIFPTFDNVQSNQLRGGTSLFYDSEPEIDMFNSIDTDLVISPNPSSGLFIFNNLNFENENVSIIIYNSLGQKVYDNDIKFQNEYTVDLSNLEKGVYFSSFRTNSTTIKSTLIIN